MREHVGYLCDTNEERLAWCHDALKNGRPGLRRTTDYKEVLGSRDIDLVYIGTPPATHHQLALAALKAGKHVFSEKPLALNLAEAKEMQA